MDQNLNKNIKDTLLEIYDNFKYQNVLSIYLVLNILPTLVSSTTLISLIPTSTLTSTFSILVKGRYKRSQKLFNTNKSFYFIKYMFCNR